MPPSCPLCEAPVPPEVAAGPAEATFTCSGCYINLTWKNGGVMPTPRASAPGAPPPRPSSPILSPLSGLPSAPRSTTGPIPRPRASMPQAQPEWGSDATAVERPSTERYDAPGQWNDATSVEPPTLGGGRIHPESTLVEVPAITGAAGALAAALGPAPTAPPPTNYPAWLDESTVKSPESAVPPARIPPQTQALFSPFSIPQAASGALPELPRARGTTGAFPAAAPSAPAGLKPIPRGTTGAFPAFSSAPAELKPLPRGTTGAFAAVQPSDLPPLPRAPTGAFPAVKPKSTTGAFPSARPSSPTMPASAVPSLESPRASAPTTPFMPMASPPAPQTVRVPSYGDLMSADTAQSPQDARPALVVAPGTVDSPDLGSADTSISQALLAPRASTPQGRAIGRIALTRAPAPGNETAPALEPVGDAPEIETKADLRAIRAALGDGDAPEPRPTSELDALPPEPTPPPPGLVTEVRGTPPVAPPRVKKAASVGQGALIAVIAVPIALLVVGGGGWYWYANRTPDVVEIPIPPEKPLSKPQPVEPPVAKPEPPPAPVEPPKPAEPAKAVRMVGKFPVVLETDEPPNPAAAKARDLYKKGNARLAAKDKKGALAAYRASLKTYPGYVASLRGLGFALIATNDKKNAVKVLRSYLEYAPDAPDAAQVKKTADKLAKKKK